MGFLAGDYTPHPNSLLFNAVPIFWPFKFYWLLRKVSTIPVLYAPPDHLCLLYARAAKSC